MKETEKIEIMHFDQEGYLEDGGRAYRNTPWLQVYGRAGTPCPRCGAPLQKTTVAGRGTVFCPACQPLL